MPSQSGTAVIILADKSAILAQNPSPTCLVAIAEVTYAFSSTAGIIVVTQARISGASWGSAIVSISLEHDSIPVLSVQAPVTSGHEWTAVFDLSTTALPYGAVARVSADVVTPSSVAHAEQLITFSAVSNTGALLRPGAGFPSGFEAERNCMVGGFADRFILSRSYVPLICSFWTFTGEDHKKLVGLMADAGISVDDALSGLQSVFGALQSHGRDLQPKDLPDAVGFSRSDILTVLQKAFAPLVQKFATHDPKKESPQLNSFLAAGGITYGRPFPLDVQSKAIRASSQFAGEGFLGMTLNSRGLRFGIGNGIYHYVNLGWLGILHYDRLRIRPSGLFAGEQVFSLSLAPGEEVTFTQKSETKKSRSFEDVIDSTIEKELEFKSVWSTEFSQEDTVSHETKLGLETGLPTDAELKAAASAEDVNKLSAVSKVRHTQDVTSAFTNKAKLEHKTTFKIQTDTTDEVTAKRVVRNYNPSRVLTLNYYKLYQKYRVVLERYDAKLCASYCLEDPCANLRQQLLDEIAKYNQMPDPTQFNCPSTDSVNHTDGPMTVNVDQYENAYDWTGAYNKPYAVAKIRINVPQGEVIAHFQDPKILGWIWRYNDGDKKESSSTEDEYFRQGGSWSWNNAKWPVTGAPGPQDIEIKLTVPMQMPVDSLHNRPWHTEKVTFQLDWTSAPDEAHIASAQTCVLHAIQQVRDSFSVERIRALVEQLKANTADILAKRVLDTQLLKDYVEQQIDPPSDLLEQVRRWFDWDEMSTEYLPWWMTPMGVQNHDKILLALNRLPAEIKSQIHIGDLFMASYARVYVPIHPGAEKEVVKTWAGIEGTDLTDMLASVQDFVDWRTRNLGPIHYNLPNYEDVMHIGPPLATPAAAAQWKNNWEKPRRKFLVLDEWAESLPTDGVHAEPQLSSCGSTDDLRTSALIAGLSVPATSSMTP